ncbi:peptidylprolyl isomerase [Caldithrix abyssi]|nr:peptidylprolyl isomerase [Caldithrix abyssi]
MRLLKITVLFLFSFSLIVPQQDGANTTNDEPLTKKEKKHLQIIDGIAAIVGNKTILKSDINQTLSMTVFQRRLDPQKDLAEIEKLKKEITQSIINRKIILAMAELDSIEVQNKEVDRTLEEQINNIVSQAGSEEEAEKALGQPLRTFRREYWYDIKDMMITQKYQRELISKISVNKNDVHSFFEAYKDSIPFFPTTVKIRHLLVKVTPNQIQIDKTVKRLKEIRQNVIDGTSTFADIAAQYSQDPGSKNSGGSLGFVRRGNLVTEFEAVAFTLKPGEISLPVKTEFGYHIIETQEIRGDKIKVRHVLITPPLTDEDETTAYNKAVALKDSSITLPEFMSMIKSHSMDDQTKENGGSLGWVDPNNYPIPEFGMVLDKINQNECAGPIRSEYGYHLLWVEAIKPGGKADLSIHWNEIETLTLNKKKGDWFEKWVQDARKNFFINIVD